MRLRRSALLAAALSPAFGACAHGRRPASYLPVGAPAQHGDRTRDGVVLLLRAAEADVRAAVAHGLAVNGYAVASAGPSGRVLETAARALGGDTTLTVRAEVTPEDPSGGGVVVVVTGRYSVPSARIRNARVVQRPGERDALYARLGAVADSARRYAAPGR